jgi:predicted ATPase
MFTSFHIERFRGIPALDIEGVKPITLLVGKNNTGKTSVLEAIFLLCGATDPINTVKIANQRGQRITNAGDADTVWRSLFQGMSCEEPIKIEGYWQRGSEWDGYRHVELKPLKDTAYSTDPASPFSGIAVVGRELRIRGLELQCSDPEIADRVGTEADQRIITQALLDSKNQQVVARASRGDYSVGAFSVSATLLSSRSFFNFAQDTEQYSALVRTRREEEVLTALRLIDARIRGLAVISEGSAATVYADIGGEALIPLAVCGEGMLRLFSIALAVTATKGGVLLIDEIDNGLHHSVMQELWPLLRTLCAEHNVQLIATTHNDEMLRYALTAFRGDYDRFNLIRLDRVPTGLRAVAYDADAMEGVLETGWEVRG